MRRLIVGVTALAAAMVAVSAYATEDVVKTRKAIMDANGGAAGIGAALLKGDIPFNPATAKAVFLTMRAVAYAYGDYFPEGSGEGDTKASPKIWEDAAGFQAALTKFQQDADAALAANAADLEAFKASFGAVAGNCKSCHDAFRNP
jgi:cytochrome c556